MTPMPCMVSRGMISIKPNTHRRRQRDATVELSRVGVGGALDISVVVSHDNTLVTGPQNLHLKHLMDLVALLGRSRNCNCTPDFGFTPPSQFGVRRNNKFVTMIIINVNLRCMAEPDVRPPGAASPSAKSFSGRQNSSRSNGRSHEKVY